MKTFTSLLSVTLLAAAVTAPALYPSQANSSTLLSSSSTNSASSSSSSSATTTNQAIKQRITSVSLADLAIFRERDRRAASLTNTLAIFPEKLVTLIADYDNDTFTAEQLCALADKHQTGNHAEQSEKLAAKLYRIAADQDYAKAQYKLAVCYYKNRGIPANLTQGERMAEAVRLFTLAANQGYAPAQSNLAGCYEKNRGVPTNLTQGARLTEAVRLYTLAARQGHAKALFNLAWFYKNNRSIPANLTQGQCFTAAIRLYTLAANQGYVKAQFKLALCYERGIGVTQNLGKALELYRRAAEQKHQDAQITICKAFQKGLLPRTKEFRKLVSSYHKHLVEKQGGEQAVRTLIEERRIRLHDGIALDCQAEECTICHKRFGSLQPIAILPCCHVFCPFCIQRWFNPNPRQLCPTCRQPAARIFSGIAMKKEADQRLSQAESKESKDKKA